MDTVSIVLSSMCTNNSIKIIFFFSRIYPDQGVGDILIFRFFKSHYPCFRFGCTRYDRVRMIIPVKNSSLTKKIKETYIRANRFWRSSPI